MRRENFNSYERLLTTDLNAISLEIYNTVLDRLVASMSGGDQTGFVLGGGLVVTRNSGTELAVTAGEALVKRTTIPVGQGAYCTVGIAANTTVTVPSAHASLNRIDILVLNPTDTTISSQIRDIRIGGADAVTPQTVAKVLEYFGTPLLVVGTPDASPVAPAVPTNCLLLSEILVTAVSGVVSNASITEKAKRFELTQVSPAGVYLGDLDSAASGGTVNIGTTNAATVNIATGAGATTINLGGAGDTVVIDGTLTTVNTTNLDVTDKNITVNKGGLASSGGLAGISIEEGGSATGYIRTRTDRAAFELKAPATAGDIELVPGDADLVLTSTSTSSRAISFPNVSGTLVTTGGSGTANQVLGVNSGATNNEFKTLSTGTTGTDFAIAHSAGGIAFNLPDASATARGVVTTGTQSFTGVKTFQVSSTQSFNLENTNSTTMPIQFTYRNFSGVGAGSSTLQGESASGDVNRLSTPNLFYVNNSTASTSTTTGALVVGGGVGVGGRANVGGRVVIDDATASNSTTAGALVVTGGVGVGGRANIGGRVVIDDATASTSTNTGALVVTGGVGVSGRANIGGRTIISDATAGSSTDPTVGALVVTGGIGTSGTITAAGGWIELGQGRVADGAAYLDLKSAAAAADYNARLIRNTGPNGSLQLLQTGTGAIDIDVAAAGGTGAVTANCGSGSFLALRRGGTDHVYVDNNGTAVRGRIVGVSAGFVGEELFASYPTTVNVGSSFGTINDGSGIMDLTLTTGIWTVTWHLTYFASGGVIQSALGGLALNGAVTSQGPIVSGSYSRNRVGSSGANLGDLVVLSGVVNMTVTTGGAIQLRGRASSTTTVDIVGNSTFTLGTYIQAIRIA